MKTKKSRHETAVQGTNDSSIVSKLSMVRRGYFSDPYLGEVVRQPCRRAPLINRGYYIRSAVIDRVFKTFLQSYASRNCQIVCLGAGYDTAFYRLFADGLLTNCSYFEVDFDRVLAHKQALIDASPLLSGCVSEAAKTDTCVYRLVPCDLKCPGKLTGLLEKAGIDWSAPTLLVSECVLTYLTPTHSADVIAWAGSQLTNAVIAIYEQTHPKDPFGQVMLQHFRKLGSPIEVACSTTSLHIQRLLSNGWSESCCHTALECYDSLVDELERARLLSLEPFDEYEEWHLKAQHYVLSCATKGACTGFDCIVDKCARHQVEPPPNKDSSAGVVPCRPVPFLEKRPGDKSSASLHRFSHSSVLHDDALCLFNGFGVAASQTHQRLSGVDAVGVHVGDEAESTSLSSVGSLKCEGVFPEFGMFARAVQFDPSDLFLFDGRASPMKCSAAVHHISLSRSASSAAGPQSTCDGRSASSNGITSQASSTSAALPSDAPNEIHVTCSPVACNGESPCPRWRHTATGCTIEDRHCAILYGGRSSNVVALADAFALDILSSTWTPLKACSGSSPSARHSHSAAAWRDNKLVVSGGLASDECLCSDAYWIMDVSRAGHGEVSWTVLELDAPLPSRYSHTSHVIGDTLVLVGGVTATSSQPSVVLIDLCKRTWAEFVIEVNPHEPLLLHNHTSHVIQRPNSLQPMLLLVGGGGNCFSFGTHFNRGPFALPLPMLAS